MPLETSQIIKLVDGLTPTIQASVISLSNHNGVAVAIVDGSGNQITSFGGGTQYAENTTQATATGTVALGKNGSNVVFPLQLDAANSNALKVSIVAGGGSGGTASNFGSSFPSTGTAIGVKDSTATNMTFLKVDSSNNLNINTASLTYPVSTNNSTSAQLGAGATFTGTIETIQNLQAAQIEVVCDQPYTLNIYQYIDAGGTQLSSIDTFTRTAGSPLNENITLPGNYFKLALTNNGASTTTTLKIDTTFGIMNTTPRTNTNLGNYKVALNEINGTVLNIGQQTAANSIPVILPSATITTLTPPTIVTVTQGTGTNLHTVVDSGNITVLGDITVSGSITTQNLNPNSGTATAGSTVAITTLNATNTIAIQVTGTYTGALTPQVSVDGSNWIALSATALRNVNTNAYAATIASAAVGIFQADISGYAQFRISANAAVTGTAVVTIKSSNAAGVVTVSSPLPAGSATIGGVTIASGTVTAVTAITNALPAGTNLMGKVGIDQTTVGTTNAVSIAQIGATTVVNGGVAGTLAVGGTTASGSALTANPATKGGLAKTANPTAVADGQVVNSLHDKLGKQIVVGSIRDLKGNQVTTITSSTSETTVVTAVAATFLDVYGCIIANTSATATSVIFKDSTAGTTQFEFEVPATETRGFMLPEGGAFKQTTVNNNWTATCGTSVASVIITMLYVKNL